MSGKREETSHRREEQRTQKTEKRKARGAVLIITFIIMATLLAITVAFLYMNSVCTKGSGYDIASLQAFWLAEAGIQQVIYQIKNDSDYRDSPTTVNGDLGNGSYSVAVTKSGEIYPFSYIISSTGTVSVVTRKLTQTTVVSATDFVDAFDYAVFGNTNTNTLTLKNDVTISGDLYYDGDVKVKTDASVINGLVYADEVTGDGSYTEAPSPPEPVPTYPTFDTTWYDSQITTAETQATSNWILSGTDTYDLNGGTVYYKEIKIKDNATVTGTGTIVATKDVTIKDGANISPNVTIITKKNLKVKNNAVIQSGSILYARKDITLKDSVNVKGCLLAPENNKTVKLQNNANFTGIIYASKANIKDDAVISGSVVANEYTDNNIKNNATVTFNMSSIPSAVPPGLEIGNVTVTLQKDWDEVVPAS